MKNRNKWSARTIHLELFYLYDRKCIFLDNTSCWIVLSIFFQNLVILIIHNGWCQGWMSHGIQDIDIMFGHNFFLPNFSCFLISLLQPACWSLVLSVHHPIQHGAAPALAVQELQARDLAHTAQLGSHQGPGDLNHTRGSGGDYLLYLHSSHVSG